MSGRQIHLYRDRDAGRLVLGVAQPNPLTFLACVQDEVLQVTLHNLEPLPVLTVVRPFREIPTDFTSARAAVCPAADSPPRSGTFKLTVGDQTTPALTWPADLSTAELLAEWKAAVLTALKALSNVADGDIVADDPTDAPGHFLYFRWADVDRDDPISVTENRLIPDCAGEQFGTLSDAGYSQLIKLSQLPYKATETFVHPTLPPATITSTMTGTTGVNAEQVLYLPSGAGGSFALQWSGARTASLDVLTVAASEIQAALNAIVAAGDSDPSFAVSARSATDGRRFVIVFTGPLAAAPQPALVVVMLDQLALPYAVGSLDLRGNLGIEQALNGSAAVDLVFELTLDEAEKYLIPLRLANSATNAGTMDEIVTSGGVVTITTTVYVDAGLGEPFASTAPGLSFTPPSSGSSFNFAHPFTSFFVPVKVFHQEDDDPETWRECGDTEYGRANVDNGHVVVSFPFVIATPDLGKWRILLFSPDIAVSYFAHKHPWDDLLETLPDGQTLTDKLTALEAAIAMIGGVLNINVTNLTGLIKSTQINVTELSTSLVSNAAFVTALTNLFLSNTDVINAISTALTTNSTFTQTLLTQLQNATVVKQIALGLLTNPDFAAMVREIIYGLLQSGVLPGGGAILHVLPDFSAIVPPFQDIPGPTLSVTRPQVQTVTTTAPDGTQTATTTALQVTASEATSLRIYLPLSPAVTSPSSSGNKTGLLPDTATAGNVYTVVTSAWSRESATGRPRGETFADGAKITFGAGHWYEVVLIGSIYYAKEAELPLVRDSVGGHELFGDNGSRYSLDLPLALALEGNVEGRITVVVETGVRTGGAATLGTFTVNTSTNVLTRANILSDGDIVRVSTSSALPSPLVAGTDYYVLNADSSGFQLALTSGGAAIDITTSGTGTQTVTIPGATDVSAITWTSLFTEELALSAATIAATYNVVIERAANATLTGTFTRFGRVGTFTPTAGILDIRARLTKFDINDTTNPAPVGALLVNVTKPIASIIQLSA